MNPGPDPLPPAPQPLTRRQAMAAASLAAVALRPQAAFAAGADAGPLGALVAYQQQVVLGYELALGKAPLDDRDRRLLEPFRRDAEQAAAALRAALEHAGGKPLPKPDPATAPAPSDASRRGYVRGLIAAEEAAVAGYYAALQDMSDERHLAGGAAFMAQAGRRLVALRKLAGEQLLPRAFETGGA